MIEVIVIIVIIAVIAEKLGFLAASSTALSSDKNSMKGRAKAGNKNVAISKENELTHKEIAEDKAALWLMRERQKINRLLDTPEKKSEFTRLKQEYFGKDNNTSVVSVAKPENDNKAASELKYKQPAISRQTRSAPKLNIANFLKESEKGVSAKYHTQNLDKVEFRPEYCTLSQLCKIVGISKNLKLNNFMVDIGCAEKSNGNYVLTTHGAKLTRNGGIAASAGENIDVVYWPIDFGKELARLKLRFLNDIPIRLYHMTHITNLQSILADGLYSNKSAPSYVDISNKEVNSRRGRRDPIHNASIHEYVPMYFNPRNAMLYEKEREHGEDIVILEIEQVAMLSAYTIFSEKNAASATCRFSYSLEDLAKFDWMRINRKSWLEDGISNIDVKQFMMSECLVYGYINKLSIKSIHTSTAETHDKVQKIVNDSKKEQKHFAIGAYDVKEAWWNCHAEFSTELFFLVGK